MSDLEDWEKDDFVAKLEQPKTSKPKTYQESRRQALAAQVAKNKANALKPYRQREEEARREGMDKNLFERELEKKDGPGKAMGMMMKMGYKVGEGLGKKRDIQEEPSRSGGGGGKESAAVAGKVADDDDDEAYGRGGIGSSKRMKVDEEVTAEETKESTKVEPASSGHRFEPIAVSLWAGETPSSLLRDILKLNFVASPFSSPGRKGLGSRAPLPPLPRPIAISDPSLDPAAYRSRAAIDYAEKKAEGQLGAARRTVVELDERENRGVSLSSRRPPSLLSSAR